MRRPRDRSPVPDVASRHGISDQTIYASRDALLRLGVPVVFREYPMAHEIWPEALREIVRWLDERVLSPVLHG